MDSGALRTNSPTRQAGLQYSRLKTLSILQSGMHNVIFLEAYTVEEFLLDITMSSWDFTYAVTTRPWSMSLGHCVSEDELTRRRARMLPIDIQLNEYLRRPKVEFDPRRLIRLVLASCDGPVIIVSSDFSKIVGSHNKLSLLDHLVFNEISPGIQRCHLTSCTRPVAAVAATGGRARTFYCSTHALAVEDRRLKVVLYNPMYVSVAAHDNNFVVSAMDIEDFFQVSPTGLSTTPTRRRMIWTPILKMAQPRRPISSVMTKRLHETAENHGLLDVVADRSLPTRGRRGETYGSAFRLSMSSALFKKALESYTGLCRLGPSITLEDLPYDWELFHNCTYIERVL